MAGIMDKLHFIRKSLNDRDRSENTVILLNQLKSDDEYLPVYKVSIKILALATLDLLEIEKYNGSDDDVQLWKENLQYLME
ncbi:TPA: hypothetical protein ACGOVU_001948 [Streptococcus suis]|nr:hypothetical protein [Streptococcus suis]HEM5985261.1 hypothetical protein [Streptococcus suis]HEM6190990.1 hypothetical protein [Streptococcus suis]HEM6345974.1 hypothetical protein [Streptococcus suis]